MFIFASSSRHRVATFGCTDLVALTASPNVTPPRLRKTTTGCVCPAGAGQPLLSKKQHDEGGEIGSGASTV